MNHRMHYIQRTMSLKKSILFGLILLTGLAFTSCKKEPGPGGKSTVYGKVWVKDYNASFTVLEESYYGPDLWVYIVYGDDRDYGDRIRTSYDGTFEFKYLRPGNYRIYTYSVDSTLQTNADVPVMYDVTVPSGRQEIQIPDLVIFK